MSTNEKLRAALSGKVAFHKLNAEHGEGEALAEEYGVRGYPTYVLTDAGGAVVDRWIGFGTAKEFLARMREALADPTTLDQKAARYASRPNVKEAKKLAALYSWGDRPVDALRYLNDLVQLDPARADNYRPDILDAYHEAWKGGSATIDDVRSAADRVLSARKPEPNSVFDAAAIMGDVARKEGDRSIAGPYYSRALAVARASKDEKVRKRIPRLEVGNALYAEGDEARAISLMRASMPAGWEENSDKLNEFAWWCFQNRVNLEDAERLARAGAELAEPGPDRAAILDTAAEICNARGNCADAVALEGEAARQDPENSHYKKRQAEFEALLAKKQGEKQGS